MATVQSAFQPDSGAAAMMRSFTMTVNGAGLALDRMGAASRDAFALVPYEPAARGMARLQSATVHVEEQIMAAGFRQQEFNSQVADGQKKAAGLSERLKKIVGSAANMGNLKMGIGFVSDALSADHVQTEAEGKLKAGMQMGMGASPESVQSIKDLAAAQQRLGVVSDEVQLAGAGQLASFLNTDSALGTLIPAMNDMAVGQNGLAVSGEDMAKIGVVMGQAMQGQVDSLRQLGLSYTDAQAQIMRYGDEQERAATLAQIVSAQTGGANAAMANTPMGQIQQLSGAWNSVKEAVGDRLGPAALGFFETLSNNMPVVQGLILGLTGGLNMVFFVLSGIVELAGAVAGFILDNWSMIGPVVWGIVAAIGAYTMAMAANNLIQGIGNGLKAASAIASGIFGASLTGEAAAATGAAAAQTTFNTALLACPLTWIVIAIIALIAVIFMVVGAINHFMGTSVSATGVISAAFATLGAFVINTFVIPLWNMIARFINFFYNVWNDPVAAVKILFLDMASSILGYIINMAHGIEAVINKIPGVEVDMTSGLSEFKSKIDSLSAKVKSESEWKEVVKELDYIDQVKTAQDAYQGGADLENNMKNLFNKDSLTELLNGFGGQGGQGGAAGGTPAQESMDGIYNNTGATAGNTARMADTMDVLDEELKYMRDAAEQEIINRFTLAELKLDVTNHNTLKKQTDFEDMNRQLGSLTNEVLAASAEGVYA